MDIVAFKNIDDGQLRNLKLFLRLAASYMLQLRDNLLHIKMDGGGWQGAGPGWKDSDRFEDKGGLL